MLKLLSILFFFLLISSYLFSQSLYSATGKASFYANKFNGRKTASGEIFSNKNLTAAHRTLPFGTMVKVTNLETGKSTIVRINDRGPYIKGRIIDLTRAAADSIDILHDGWAKVSVEELPELPIPIITETALPLVDSGAFKFPDDWIGTWKGELKIYSESELKERIFMQLTIQPMNDLYRWSWIMVYDTSVRNYELVKQNAEEAIYSIDEKSGIIIRGFVFGNHFVSRFAVADALLDCDYHLISENEMTFEIFSGKENHTWTTGNTLSQNDSVPAVKVYPLEVLQEATLHRVEE